MNSMQLLFDIFSQTLQTLWAHKLRSFLTMFGIAWGVGSLLLLVGLGEGFRSGQRRQMATMGQDIIMLWSGRVPAQSGSGTGQRQYYLTYRDYQDIVREAKHVRNAAPLINRGDIRAVSDITNANGQVNGTTPSLGKIRHFPAPARAQSLSRHQCIGSDPATEWSALPNRRDREFHRRE